MNNIMKESFERWTKFSLYWYIIALLSGFTGWMFSFFTVIEIILFILLLIEVGKWLWLRRGR